MKTKEIVFSIVIIALIAIGIFAIARWKRSENQDNTTITPMGTLTLISPAFKDNESMPAAYTCEGSNVNPPLLIQGTPETAKSMALIMDDPDAVFGTWDHWVVWNIDPKTAAINENEAPAGAMQGATSFGDQKYGYGGPCPPKGTGAHRYHFKLYALDVILTLPPQAKKKDVEKSMEGHIIDETVLTGLYEKKIKAETTGGFRLY